MTEHIRREFTLLPYSLLAELEDLLKSLPNGTILEILDESEKIVKENNYWKWEHTPRMYSAEMIALGILQTAINNSKKITLKLWLGKNEENKQKRPRILLGQKITTHEELLSLPVGSVLISHIRQSKRLHHVFSVKKGNNAWETADAELEPDRHMQGLIGCCDTYLHELPEQEEQEEENK